MQKIISYLSDLIFRRKKTVLLGSLILWLFCLWLSSGLKLSEDLFELIPKNDPLISEYRQLLDAFKFMDKVFVMIGPECEGVKISDDCLISAGDKMENLMRQSGYFSKIYYIISDDSLFPVIDIFKEYRAAFFSEEYRKYIENAIERKELEQRFAGWRKVLTEAPAPYIGQMFKTDPAGFDFYLLNKLNDLRGSGKLKNKRERIFSGDGRWLVISGQPKISAGDIEGSGKFVKFMEDAVSSVSGGEKIRAAYLCGHRFSMENADKMKHGAKLAIIISMLAIIMLSVLIYRKPLFVAMSILPAVFGSVIALGITSVIYKNVSGISIACGSMLTGIAVDYGIYLLFQIDKQKGDFADEETVKSILRKIYLPLLIGAATTVGVFGVMFFSNMPGYSQLSVFASIGIISAAFFALFVFPLIIPLKMKNFSEKPLWNVSAFFEKIFNFAVKKRRVVFAMAILVTVAALPGIFKLRFDGDVQSMNVSSAAIERDRKDIVNVVGDPLQEVIFAVKDKNPDSALQKNARLSLVLNELKKQDQLTGFSSIAAFLPSSETLNNNIGRWDKFWTDERLSDFKTNINQISETNKIKADVFNEFQESLSNKSVKLISEETYKGTFLEDVFSIMLASNQGLNFIISRGQLADGVDFSSVVHSVKEVMPDAIIYRGLEMTGYIMNIVYGEFKKNGVLSFLAAALIMRLFFRRSKDVILTMAVLCLSLVWTFGLMGWLGMKINIMNCVVSIFVFGLVIDYSVFLISAMKEKKANEFMRNTGGAVISSALTVVAGFGALCFGCHPALVSLGVSSVIAVLSGIIAVVFLIPAIYSMAETLD